MSIMNRLVSTVLIGAKAVIFSDKIVDFVPFQLFLVVHSLREMGFRKILVVGRKHLNKRRKLLTGNRGLTPDLAQLFLVNQR